MFLNYCGDDDRKHNHDDHNQVDDDEGLDLANAVPGHLVAYEDLENDLLLAGDLSWKYVLQSMDLYLIIWKIPLFSPFFWALVLARISMIRILNGKSAFPHNFFGFPNLET